MGSKRVKFEYKRLVIEYDFLLADLYSALKLRENGNNARAMEKLLWAEKKIENLESNTMAIGDVKSYYEYEFPLENVKKIVSYLVVGCGGSSARKKVEGIIRKMYDDLPEIKGPYNFDP